jgi:hypothetical protein
MKNHFPLMGLPLLGLLLGACGLELRKNGEPNPIHLERVYAPVDRYDCHEQLISSRTEEVQHPSKWVRIEADNKSRIINTASVKNLSLRPDTNTGMHRLGSHSLSFQVHISNTWLAYQVSEGLNEFSYELSESTSDDPFESGTVWLEVSYSERWDTEKRIIRPSPEECETEE